MQRTKTVTHMAQKKLTQFEQDLSIPLMVNNTKSSRGWYNLVVSRRDFKLFQIGMKPNRHWKFTAVKQYFGIKGNKDKAVEAIEKILEDYKAGKYAHLEASVKE